MDKIQMQNPIVELDGDEMTRVMWKWIKEKLIEPYVELNVVYYDLYLKNRDNTNDKVTIEAAHAIKKYGVGVKCATITANKDRKAEYDLKTILPSPNATIRKILDGTVFRKPITIDTIIPIVPGWKKPITIARHSFGDIYVSKSFNVEAGTKAELVFTESNNNEKRYTIHNFTEDGIVMGEYNLIPSILNFAETCFKYAISEKCNLIFSTKDTIVKAYDYAFKDIFERLYDTKYKDEFDKLNITFKYTLIDDAVSQIIKSNGDIIWACKNYDGDVMSDLVATGFGSLALMTSVLVSPDGVYEYEAAHGTVKNHYYKYLKGELTSTNPVALIFTWTGALRKRGELDSNNDLVQFSDIVEQSTISTINKGIVTKDLFNISTVKDKKWVNTQELIDKIAEELKSKLTSALV